tara:strand:- start:1122 stop:2012 length:891 start_codon:yes stop_codon:yes gene_type:complete
VSNKNRIIIFSSDHNGIETKDKLVNLLEAQDFTCIDLGPFLENGKVDYVDYANQLSKIVASNGVEKGILICGTGVGMSIAANRHSDIRAALVHNITTAPKCREHNDANVLCLGSWVTSHNEIEEIVQTWLDTDFGEGRHVKRVEKLSNNKRKKIVFTNGVFDILHTGHVDLIRFAKTFGEKLVVGINSDLSVKRIKGDSRPINNQNDRKRILEALQEVDEVIIFDEDDPKNIRDTISPDVIVKGGEWSADQVRQRDTISQEVEIKIFPLVKDYSTTGVLEKIRQIETHEKSNKTSQ